MTALLSRAQFKGVYVPPERVHEIENAMPYVWVGKQQGSAPEQYHGGRSVSDRAALARRRVAMDLMQSDVPAEHLAGLQAIHVGARLPEGTRARHVGQVKTPGVGYIETVNNYDLKKQEGGRAGREERRRDLVHEIGHHVDLNAYRLYSPKGGNEARAENYADEYLGTTRTPVPSVYDNPANRALSPMDKHVYSSVRKRS